MSKDELTDEDKNLFRQMMKTVKPLKQTKKATFKEPLGPIYNSSSKSRRPETCSRVPDILLNTQEYCREKDRNGYREQVAGRKITNGQKPLIFEKKYHNINYTIANHNMKLQEDDIDKQARALQHNLSNYNQDAVNSDSIIVYSKSSIPHKQLIKLKNGQIPWQARLDLHGLNEESAKDALCEFIIKQLNHGNRCLLIIHGKGSKHGEAPILKNLVNRWLRQLPEILAFHSALGRDGGSGAVYVLLKRK